MEAELFWKETRLRLLENIPESEAGGAAIEAVGGRLTGKLARKEAEDFPDHLTDKQLRAKLPGYINRNPRVCAHCRSFSREKFWRRKLPELMERKELGKEDAEKVAIRQ